MERGGRRHPLETHGIGKRQRHIETHGIGKDTCIKHSRMLILIHIKHSRRLSFERGWSRWPPALAAQQPLPSCSVRTQTRAGERRGSPTRLQGELQPWKSLPQPCRGGGYG